MRDFVSIMDAVDVVPENGLNCVIRIKTGVYDEIVTVGKKKCNVVFIGDCVKTTVVTGNRSNHSSHRQQKQYQRSSHFRKCNFR